MCVMCQFRVAGKYFRAAMMWVMFQLPQNSYNVCHASSQSSWEVAQSSYDVCHVKVL